MKSKYVVCVNSGSYKASLEIRKIYRTLPDEAAEERGWIRVDDESAEDYLFPSSYFVPIELTAELEKALAIAD